MPVSCLLSLIIIVFALLVVHVANLDFTQLRSSDVRFISRFFPYSSFSEMTNEYIMSASIRQCFSFVLGWKFGN
jgi:hypothetical protein